MQPLGTAYPRDRKTGGGGEGSLSLCRLGDHTDGGRVAVRKEDSGAGIALVGAVGMLGL